MVFLEIFIILEIILDFVFFLNVHPDEGADQDCFSMIKTIVGGCQLLDGLCYL